MMRRRRRKRRPGWGSCGDERVVGLGFGGVITEREMSPVMDGWTGLTDCTFQGIGKKMLLL
jgi:hypothetical protein